MGNWLVWNRGLRGPEAQVHFYGSDKGPSLSKTEAAKKLTQHQLKNDEQALPLDTLIKLYPAPVQRVEL